MRHIVLIICILGAFVVPWWLMLIALLITVFLYRRYFQALIPALLIDVIHGGANFLREPFNSVTLWITIGLLILLFAELYLKDTVRA